MALDWSRKKRIKKKKKKNKWKVVWKRRINLHLHGFIKIFVSLFGLWIFSWCQLYPTFQRQDLTKHEEKRKRKGKIINSLSIHSSLLLNCYICIKTLFFVLFQEINPVFFSDKRRYLPAIIFHFEAHGFPFVNLSCSLHHQRLKMSGQNH